MSLNNCLVMKFLADRRDITRKRPPKGRPLITLQLTSSPFLRAITCLSERQHQLFADKSNLLAALLSNR